MPFSILLTALFVKVIISLLLFNVPVVPCFTPGPDIEYIIWSPSEFVTSILFNVPGVTAIVELFPGAKLSVEQAVAIVVAKYGSCLKTILLKLKPLYIYHLLY